MVKNPTNKTNCFVQNHKVQSSRHLFLCAKITRINSLFLCHHKSCLNIYLNSRIIGYSKIAVNRKILKRYNDVQKKPCNQAEKQGS